MRRGRRKNTTQAPGVKANPPETVAEITSSKEAMDLLLTQEESEKQVTSKAQKGSDKWVLTTLRMKT